MYGFDNDIRRKHSNLLTSYVERVMLKVSNGERSAAGWNVFVIHTVLVMLVYYLMLWTNSKKGFLFGLVVWILIVLQHLYFGGCWGVKSERRIWRVKDWYGPWTVLFNFLHSMGMPATNSYHNVIFIISTIVLSVFVVERYISFYT